MSTTGLQTTQQARRYVLSDSYSGSIRIVWTRDHTVYDEGAIIPPKIKAPRRRWSAATLPQALLVMRQREQGNADGFMYAPSFREMTQMESWC